MLPPAPPLPHPVRAVQELDARHGGDPRQGLGRAAGDRGAGGQGRARRVNTHLRPGITVYGGEIGDRQ